ncbi:hypothetical protein DLAC_10990 [Tieghemostelium lacteum]|uniref:F-box domain-containing protein n=1 Tax=Tieghemostelium lacteum TaxID=361077 RepID=A0A151Z2W3_TIELA|nr:hypothetical protein DLAC_10990 [Tieghemostelium lacteum]|eukprot:KYQ88295.1 hypothetical protein DLAC_10990 [Tieghemostelium lacteum]
MDQKQHEYKVLPRYLIISILEYLNCHLKEHRELNYTKFISTLCLVSKEFYTEIVPKIQDYHYKIYFEGNLESFIKRKIKNGLRVEMYLDSIMEEYIEHQDQIADNIYEISAFEPHPLTILAYIDFKPMSVVNFYASGIVNPNDLDRILSVSDQKMKLLEKLNLSFENDINLNTQLPHLLNLNNQLKSMVLASSGNFMDGIDILCRFSKLTHVSIDKTNIVCLDIINFLQNSTILNSFEYDFHSQKTNVEHVSIIFKLICSKQTMEDVKLYNCNMPLSVLVHGINRNKSIKVLQIYGIINRIDEFNLKIKNQTLTKLYLYKDVFHYLENSISILSLWVVPSSLQFIYIFNSHELMSREYFTKHHPNIVSIELDGGAGRDTSQHLCDWISQNSPKLTEVIFHTNRDQLPPDFFTPVLQAISVSKYLSQFINSSPTEFAQINQLIAMNHPTLYKISFSKAINWGISEITKSLIANPVLRYIRISTIKCTVRESIQEFFQHLSLIISQNHQLSHIILPSPTQREIGPDDFIDIQRVIKENNQYLHQLDICTNHRIFRKYLNNQVIY